VRYDPRDLSRIYILAPDGQYYEVGYRDVRRAPVSLWEHRRALKALRDEGRGQVDENAIFAAIDKQREIVDEAIVSTKAARRQRERQLRGIKSGQAEPTSSWEEDDEGRPLELLPFEEWT
jgi:putative transposase